MTLKIVPARVTDDESVRALLGDAALPVEDLQTAPVRLWVARDGSRVVGCVGLERYGSSALLRSLVVATAYRRAGLGQELVFTLERAARDSGVKLLALLTQTAEPFFTRLRYAVIDRAYLPDEMLQSAQFRSLCPSSATCMTKSLHRLPPIESK